MKTVILAALIVLGLASTSAAQSAEPKDSIFLHALITGVGATAGGDIYTTGVALGSLPKAYEKNIALRWATSSPAGLGLVKGTIAVGQVQGLVWLHKRSKLATYLIGAGTIAMNTYAIQHNAKLVTRR